MYAQKKKSIDSKRLNANSFTQRKSEHRVLNAFVPKVGADGHRSMNHSLKTNSLIQMVKRGGAKGGGSHGKTLKCKIRGWTDNNDVFHPIAPVDIELGTVGTHNAVPNWTAEQVKAWIKDNHGIAIADMKSVDYKHWT